MSGTLLSSRSVSAPHASFRPTFDVLEDRTVPDGTGVSASPCPPTPAPNQAAINALDERLKDLRFNHRDLNIFVHKTLHAGDSKTIAIARKTGRAYLRQLTQLQNDPAWNDYMKTLSVQERNPGNLNEPAWFNQVRLREIQIEIKLDKLGGMSREQQQHEKLMHQLDAFEKILNGH